MKCKNCAAELLYSADKTKLICPYCDTVIFLDPPQKSSNKSAPDPPPPPAKRRIQLLGDSNNMSNSGLNTWNQIHECMSSPKWVLNDYYNYFKARAQNSNYCAIPGINDHLINKVIQRLNNVIAPNEEVFFYMDKGIISRAKSGVLITNAKIYLLEKNRTVFFYYRDISTFVTGPGVNSIINTWLINNDANAALEEMGCSDKQLGILISFLCEASFQLTDKNEDRIISIDIK
ncbi:MAG: hypothetical protein ACI4I9_06845 [Porcipelethomonas sp.]